MEQRGFLTLFTDVNGYGDWCRRWARLRGNSIHFWKYPEDESNRQEPTEMLSLSGCITEDVSLAPRDVCSRMNTFMLETRRPWRRGDQESLVVTVVSAFLRVDEIMLKQASWTTIILFLFLKLDFTFIRHLFSLEHLETYAGKNTFSPFLERQVRLHHHSPLAECRYAR